MRDFYENYDDLDDFDKLMNDNYDPDAHLRAQERREHAEDAFMDDLSTPAPENLMPSIEHNEAEMSHNSSYASHHQAGDASASTSFQVPQSRVKSESEEVVNPFTAEPRHGSLQPQTQGHSSGTAGPAHNSSPPPTNDSLPSPPGPYQDMSVQPPGIPPAPVDELIQQQAALEIADSDHDDDVMIIEPTNAPAQAQRKWQQHQNATADDVVFIKSEPRDAPVPAAPVTPPPKKQAYIHTVLAQQRAMIARRAAPNGGSNGAANALPRTSVGSTSGWREDSPQAEDSGTNNKGKGKEIVHPRQEPSASDFHAVGGREDPMQVDAALGAADEDHSWMDQDDDADEEYEEMKAGIAALQKKQAGNRGVLSNVETMQLFKLKKQLEVKERLISARAQPRHRIPDDNGDQLFVPESRNEVIRRHRRNQPGPEAVGSDVDEDDNVDDFGNDDSAFSRMLQQELGGGGIDAGEGSSAQQDLGLTKSGKPRKRRAKNAREVIEQEEQQRREKERGKASKKRTRPSPKAPKNKGTKVAAKTRAKTKEKKSAKGKGKKGLVKNGPSLLSNNFRSFNGEDAVGRMILEDLMTNDPIQDRILNPIFNQPSEPSIHGKMRKDTQFQQLFANIPDDGTGASKKAARDDKKKLKIAARSFGYAQCKAQDGKWLIKGMKSTLYHHQLLGAQWMVQRELSSQPPNGGLLADSMGLGKTVQMLACMVGNPPGDLDIQRGTKATLIVVPAGVIDQWIDEIRHHTHENIFRKVIHYKTSTKLPQEILSDCHIVVTSYNEVMKQFPYPDNEGRQKIQEGGYEKWWEDAKQEMGNLHRIQWYRVVLDEAQAIKNNSARTSLACQNLKSVYRWCLTGTPLLNRLEELFPYLRFLKANYTMDWAVFQKYFCDVNAEDSYSRISTLLSYTMMRRTMKTTILNRPIITLPKPHPQIIYVQFSPEEQIIYRITENRFRSNLNTFFAKGSAGRNYGVFMVQLLRLRQCTGHPFMLERTIKESWTLEDVQELQHKLARLKADTRPFYEQCKAWVEHADKTRSERFMGGEEGEETLPFGRGDYGHNFNFTGAMGSLSEEQMFRRVVCGICADMPMGPVRTDCGHIFCEECISGHMQNQVSIGNEYMTCPSCERVFINTEHVRRGQAGISEDDDYERHSATGDNGHAGGSGSTKKGKQATSKYSKGRDALGFEPATGDSTWVAKSDCDADFPLTPSSKTTALKSILLHTFMQAPLDKAVIYVQFRTLARIIGRICESEGWGFLYLTGDSTLEHRTKAIRKFRDDPNIKILIAGLKCGGLGLNFPWANRCFSLDLWWNHAVEQQAFGRIFRIGQEKETYMTRLVVRNTVDMRMMSMQLHKLQSLEKAMRDGEYNREQPNLSLKQLANLFGFLKTDADDNIISIEADYDDEEPQEGEGSGAQGFGGDMMDEEL
ncbi:related to protein RIS1 [Phialocephala subalpina]|uniref:Related to protein RIS1 n=1 Tax=Phialocephala subalpina TaxID=576137 RepID=A0A1L7XWL3_9HELO|nr:related to protein RIS1 [Phialocephala subalpina]